MLQNNIHINKQVHNNNKNTNRQNINQYFINNHKVTKIKYKIGYLQSYPSGIQNQIS